ncbi:MAG: dihydrolipoamide acetyltransferase family protein [Terriglobia bacterium]|jgi:pyruvate dehydrogenase E2 component (dihydrolipoamide acetyltransferase)
MVKAVVMPKLGQSEETVTIVHWRKQLGDTVAKGDILFEIETDKAILEVESFYAGTLLKIVAGEGVTVPVQTTVAFVGDPGEPVPEVVIPPVLPKKVEASRPSAAPPPQRDLAGDRRPPSSASPRPVDLPPTAPTVAEPQVFRISPRAAKLAKESAIDPTPIVGTGPAGRTVERDVKQYLEAQGYGRLRITPTAKKLAAREGINLLSLAPKEDGSQTTVADIERLLAERPKPLTRMRQIIAQRLTESYTHAPHFFVTVSADVTELEALRADLKAQGTSYTLTDFILKAAALALEQFPTVNSTSDGVSVRWRSKIHLGFAVALEQGLVVPVIRRANELTLAEIHAQAQDLTAKARAGQLTPAEMTGSTFTISNLGMMDVENFTAIINPGESGILAISSSAKQPVVRNDQVVIRSMMKMTLSSDHRLIDGALAARFLNSIRKTLEEISLWQRSI